MGGRTEGRTDGRTEGGRKTDGRAGANGRRADGRADGRADERADGGGRAAGTILNDSTTIFIDFHKKHPNTLCFSVVSRPAEAQVPIFTAQMKNASKKCKKKHSVF